MSIKLSFLRVTRKIKILEQTKNMLKLELIFKMIWWIHKSCHKDKWVECNRWHLIATEINLTSNNKPCINGQILRTWARISKVKALIANYTKQWEEYLFQTWDKRLTYKEVKKETESKVLSTPLNQVVFNILEPCNLLEIRIHQICLTVMLTPMISNS